MGSVRNVSIAVALLLVFTVAAPVSAGSSFDVIASGLLNPRGLSLGPGGRLYFAEAGVGDGTQSGGVGPTGRIAAVLRPGSDSPVIHTVLTGVVSLGGSEGETVGAAGISVDDSGTLWAVVGESQIGTGIQHPQIGRLLRVDPTTGDWTAAGNVGDRDRKWTERHPDLSNDFPNANPYGVAAVDGRRYVVDAGANTLDVVRPNGKVKVLAYIPNEAVSDAVPTCITQGPDGALYIGTLALVDSLFAGPPQPAAKIYRVDPSETEAGDLDTILSVATVWASGFWPIHGCAFQPGGALWVSEIFTGVGQQGPTGGALVRVPFNHPEDLSRRKTFGEGFLEAPGGVAVASDGTVYVVNGSTSTDGQILRLDR